MQDTAFAPAFAPAPDAPGDVELLTRVRSGGALGDPLAEQALLARHRAAVADLPASASYASVNASGRAALALVRAGRDHDLPFRMTWLAVHTHGDVPEVSPRDRVVWSAFAALPAAWKAAVWHREVEGQRPRDIARLLDMSEEQATRALASSYAALKRRAAISHARPGAGAECEDLVSTYRFSSPSFLAAAEIRALREHGRHCDDCLGLIRNLLLIEHTLRDTLAGIVLGSAADGYLAGRPRVARLRVASGSAVRFERRRVHPALASLTAAAVGAAAMAMVLSTPALSPSPAGPAVAQADAPRLGIGLEQGASLRSFPARTSLPFTPGRADHVATSGPAGDRSGGRGGSSGAAHGTPEPTAPESPTSPPPAQPPTPTDPPEVDVDPAPEETVTVGVEVTAEQVEVTLDPVVGDEPVEVEVPVPDLPVSPLLPGASTTRSEL